MIHASEHGRSLGTAIMNHVLSELGGSRAKILDIAASQKSAPFFARFGAVETAHIPGGWGPVLHRVDMELPLPMVDIPIALRTARLDMRPPSEDDGARLHAAMRESIGELREFLSALPWVDRGVSLASADSHCRTVRSRFLARRELSYFFFERARGQLAGSAGLYRPEWSIPRFEVGYWCRTSKTGQGLTTEAVRAVMRMAFDTLCAERLELITDEANVRSRRLAERTGFGLEGIHIRDRRAPDGTLRNTCVYALTSRPEGI